MTTIKQNPPKKPSTTQTQTVVTEVKENLQRGVSSAAKYLHRPYTILHTYERQNFRPDLIAGVTVAVIGIPTAIAFATLAGLPPQMGLYATIVGGIFGTLWGSSNQIQVGPTNTMSLLVLSVLSTTLLPGSPEYIVAAGMLAILVGIFQFGLGIFRLGVLVNFISHSLIIGFTFGAGLLIIIRQIAPLLGLPESSGGILQAIKETFLDLPDIQPATAVLGLLTLIIIVGLRRINRRIPGALIAMIISSLAVFLLDLGNHGVAVIGELPRGFPPLAHLPLFNLPLIVSLLPSALAVGTIGLIQSIAVARSIANQTKQRLDSNQEFVGQGIANVASGFLSGYPGSASFSSSTVNVESGAKTPVAAVFSSMVVMAAMFSLASLTAYLPVASLSAILILAALGLTDRHEIVRILRGAPGDALILLVTLSGVLFLGIAFAVLLGVILSFALYLLRTSTPRVHEVKPDNNYKHFSFQPNKPGCPQLGIIEIYGDLYFGAAHHVEEYILDHADRHPEQRYLLIRMQNVNGCDFSGIQLLESIVQRYRNQGGDIFLLQPQFRVKQIFASTNFAERFLGNDHILDKDDAIKDIFLHTLDPTICIYECPVRAFKECENLPKRVTLPGIPDEHEVVVEKFVMITPATLWSQLHPMAASASPETGVSIPLIIDVREPREFQQGHIAEAQSVPLVSILSQKANFPTDRQIVLVCRTGHRSRRAASALQSVGRLNVVVLKGGMQAWEAAKLLEMTG